MDSFRNGIYANRKDVYRSNSETSDPRSSTASSTNGSRYKDGYKEGKLGKLRKLFKKQDSDPYAATYERGNSNADEAISAIRYIVPVLKSGTRGPLDPNFDDTGVNR
ncbi:expressed unknown protein [Seminavis robusta]|uniref:Uncharacterized protein n=1 Tax=Seminavis robusta TaxID=568900 RepID=A0A9N8EK94_9STRA|nr:expressed unknown protein [Seminavis robusta]|eukprot:Sro1215_g253100.1 n/a (107) ;mRNA; r:363-683